MSVLTPNKGRANKFQLNNFISNLHNGRRFRGVINDLTLATKLGKEEDM